MPHFTSNSLVVKNDMLTAGATKSAIYTYQIPASHKNITNLNIGVKSSLNRVFLIFKHSFMTVEVTRGTKKDRSQEQKIELNSDPQSAPVYNMKVSDYAGEFSDIKIQIFFRHEDSSNMPQVTSIVLSYDYSNESIPEQKTFTLKLITDGNGTTNFQEKILNLSTSNQYVTIQAYPSSGYQFTRWEKINNQEIISENPYQYAYNSITESPNSIVTIKAYFSKISIEEIGLSNIYIGQKQVQNIYIGKTLVNSVYLGMNKIFENTKDSTNCIYGREVRR